MHFGRCSLLCRTALALCDLRSFCFIFKTSRCSRFLLASEADFDGTAVSLNKRNRRKDGANTVPWQYLSVSCARSRSRINCAMRSSLDVMLPLAAFDVAETVSLLSQELARLEMAHLKDWKGLSLQLVDPKKTSTDSEIPSSITTETHCSRFRRDDERATCDRELDDQLNENLLLSSLSLSSLLPRKTLVAIQPPRQLAWQYGFRDPCA